MRELSRLELQFASGGYELTYSPQELLTLGTTTGYTVGSIVKSIGAKSYRSSVTELAGTISLCDRGARSILDLLSSYIQVTNSMRLIFNFGCGIYSAITERGAKERRSA